MVWAGLAACAPDADPHVDPVTLSAPPDPSTANDGGGDPTGGEPTGGGTDDGGTDDGGTGGTGGIDRRQCELYLDCLAVVAPGQLPGAQEGFGSGGTCWQGSEQDAEQCLAACASALAMYHDSHPDEPKCGLCQVDGDCTDGGDCVDGECRPAGCGDEVVADDEVCDAPQCADDCQGPVDCNPVNQFGCDPGEVCMWARSPYCTVDGDYAGDGEACDYFDASLTKCAPGLFCAPVDFFPDCTDGGCCTRLCNLQVDDGTCTAGRVCTSLDEVGGLEDPELANYLGICLFP